MKTLMVIGGSGFFGKSILEAFKKKRLDPWGISNIKVLARSASTLKVTHPNLIEEGVELYDVDISTAREIPNADYVIHAAASTDAAKYISQPEVEKKNILAGTINYCELAKKYHRDSKILYCSSGAVYGQQPSDLSEIPESFQGAKLNDMVLNKQSYALAKREAEQLIQNLGREGLKVSIARCFAFVGPYLQREQHFAIGNFIEDGLRGRPINIKANRLVYRSYMHAEDLVNWLVTIARKASSDCPTYNVGSNQAILISELGIQVAKFFNVEYIIPSIDNTKIDRYIPSTLKAYEKLGLKIELNLNEAMVKTIEDIRKNG